jgi:hypothetical protein
MFDPKAHLIQLPRRVKDKATGQYVTVHDDYLEVRWRVLMFREKYPHGVITTEEIFVDLDRGYARYKATAEDDDGGRATGYGTETKADFTDYAERAETRAIGRALALLGFGTQFVGADLTEGEHVADAPVSPPASPLPLPVGEEPPPATPPERLTPEAIDRLFELAAHANEPKEVFGSRLRNLMRLSGDTRISKKFLVASMTQAQYDAARAYYEGVIREQIEADVPTHEPPPPAEGTPAVPSAAGSSSAHASADDPAEQERAKLRSMALGWGLPEREVDHVLAHHKDLEKAKNLLWRARRPWSEKTPIEAATAAD